MSNVLSKVLINLTLNLIIFSSFLQAPRLKNASLEYLTHSFPYSELEVFLFNFKYFHCFCKILMPQKCVSDEYLSIPIKKTLTTVYLE